MDKQYNKFWLECGKHWSTFTILSCVIGFAAVFIISLMINNDYSPTLADKVISMGSIIIILFVFIVGIICQTYYRRFKKSNQ